MYNQSRDYHTGYESTKAYQIEMRDIRAQDRLARQVRAVRAAGSPRPITALLRRLGSRLWTTGRRQASLDGIDTVTHPDASIAHP